MINCIGQLFGTSGYASHFRGLVNELNKLTKCKIITGLPKDFQRDVNDQELEMIKREQEFDINLIVTHPINWRSNLSGKRNFVYLIWEGDKIPKWMLNECLNKRIEKIIVPSKHTYDAIMSSGTITNPIKANLLDKIIIIPHGYNPKDFYPLPQCERVFTFLANKGFRNLEDRGGIQYLIRAYLEEFTKEDNVELILKINPAYGIPNLLEMFPELKNDNLPNIKYITESYTTKQMNELYNNCDIFVSSTRAEAFNIPCLEALACGKPVITTNYGGQTDFIDKDVGNTIDYKLTEVKHEVEYEGISWATPDHDWLKTNLRSFFDNKDNNKSDFKDKCIKRASKYTWANTAKQIHSLF